MPEVAQATDDVPETISGDLRRRQPMDAAPESRPACWQASAPHAGSRCKRAIPPGIKAFRRVSPPASRRRRSGHADGSHRAVRSGPRVGVRFGRTVCWGGGACREDISCDVVCDTYCGVFDGVSGEVGVAGGGLDLGVAEELRNYRQALAQRKRACSHSCDGGRGCARRRGRRGRGRGSRARRCWRAAAPASRRG